MNSFQFNDPNLTLNGSALDIKTNSEPNQGNSSHILENPEKDSSNQSKKFGYNKGDIKDLQYNGEDKSYYDLLLGLLGFVTLGKMLESKEITITREPQTHPSNQLDHNIKDTQDIKMKQDLILVFPCLRTSKDRNTSELDDQIINYLSTARNNLIEEPGFDHRGFQSCAKFSQVFNRLSEPLKNSLFLNLRGKLMTSDDAVETPTSTQQIQQANKQGSDPIQSRNNNKSALSNHQTFEEEKLSNLNPGKSQTESYSKQNNNISLNFNVFDEKTGFLLPQTIQFISEPEIKLNEKENMEKFVPVLEKEAKNNPNDYEMQLNVGLELLQQNKPDDAILYLANSINPDMRDPKPYIFLCIAYIWQNRFEDAISILKETLDIKPNLFDEPFLFSLLLAAQEHFEAAMFYLSNSFKYQCGNYPWYAQTYEQFARLLFDRNALEEAAAICRKAIEVDPIFINAYSMLGEVMFKQEKYDDVLEIANKVIRLDPDNKKGYYLLGRAFGAKGKFDEAHLCFQKASKIDACRIHGYLHRAEVFRKQKDFKNAISLCKKVLKIENANSDALWIMTNSLYQQGNYNDANKAVEQLLKEVPENEDIIHLKERILLKLNPKECKKYIYDQRGYIREKSEVGETEADKSVEDIKIAMDENIKLSFDDFSELPNLSEKSERSLFSDPGVCSSRTCMLLKQIYEDEGNIQLARRELEKAFQDKPKDDHYYHELASLLYQERKPNEALLCIKNAINSKFKDSHRLYHTWGWILWKQGKNEEAYCKFEKAIEIDPSCGRAHYEYGCALFDQGNYEGAVNHFKEADIHNPQCKDTYYEWGLALFRQEKYIEAIVKFKQVIQLDPEHLKANIECGRTLLLEKNLDDAIFYLKKASLLDPKNAFVYFLWGGALMMQRKYSEAASKFEKATKLDPTRSIYYCDCGHAWLELKSYANAISCFEEAIRLDKRDKLAYNYWCRALLEQKRYSEAILKFKELISFAPDDWEPYHDCGYALIQEKDYRASEIYLKEASRLNPREASIYGLWGKALFEQDKHAEAISKVAKATEIDKTYWIEFYNHGSDLVRNQNYDIAIIYFTRADNFHPEYEDLYSCWSQALFFQGKFFEALSKAKKAYQINPQNPLYKTIFGTIYLHLGILPDALSNLNAAIQLNPNNQEANYLRVECRQRLNNFKKLLFEIMSGNLNL